MGSQPCHSFHLRAPKSCITPLKFRNTQAPLNCRTIGFSIILHVVTPKQSHQSVCKHTYVLPPADTHTSTHFLKHSMMSVQGTSTLRQTCHLVCPADDGMVKAAISMCISEREVGKQVLYWFYRNRAPLEDQVSSLIKSQIETRSWFVEFMSLPR